MYTRLFTSEILYCEGLFKPEYRGKIHFFSLFAAFFVYQLNYSIVSRYNTELDVVCLDNKNVNELLLVNKVED